MKTLFFGNAFLSSLTKDTEKSNQSYSMVYTGKTSPLFGKFIAGGPSGYFKLDVYSGEPFIDEDDTHRLISFDINAGSADMSKSGFSTEMSASGLLLTLGVSNYGTPAMNNGNCTWFRYYSTRTGVKIEGTVGRVGSDSDMVVTDTTIIKGQEYKSFGFKLLIGSKIYVV